MIKGRRQCDPINGCGKFYNQHLDKCPSCDTPEAFSDFIPFNPLDWTYDLETYPNIFTADFKHTNTGARLLFEISDRKNELRELLEFLYALKETSCRTIGFNNLGFDYPIIHFIIENYHLNPGYTDIYNKAMSIINTSWNNRFDNVIWDQDIHIPQIDLFKIHHFDNKSRRTSLKILEFNMRMASVEDLPFPPGTILDDQQKDVLIDYNDHDVDATEDFYIQSIEMIEFREQLSKKHGRNFLNHSDKKIGTDLFISELEKASPGSCYIYDGGKKTKRQTIRQQIVLADVIFPYIKFKEPEFERVKTWLMQQTITNFDEEYLNIKGIFKELIATVNGLDYKFGSGGIHASVDSTIIYSDKDYIITDWDVGGYYPEIGGANNLYPEHLSNQFCVVNESLKQERKQYKKGTPLNLAIKLARNGAYGDSNNKYSPFYDPQYTMAITVNGQLMLCMLAQYLIDIPGLQIIQVNTDGLTVRCPRRHVQIMKSICEWWENYTCLELEQVNYKRMFIRDVNNYIGEYEDGKLKRKGAYAHETPLENPNTQEVLWHKNHSALVVPKAAEAALVHGQCIDDFIRNHDNIHDFMLRTKINRTDQLIIRWPEIWGDTDFPLQRITRYYISNKGGTLTKVSPPTKGCKVGQWKRANSLTDQFYQSVIVELNTQKPHQTWLQHEIDSTGLPWDERINTKNHGKYETRRTGFNVGYLVIPCNSIDDGAPFDINYNYYIDEAKKLVDPLR